LEAMERLKMTGKLEKEIKDWMHLSAVGKGSK